jgi:hypothetical protein
MEIRIFQFEIEIIVISAPDPAFRIDLSFHRFFPAGPKPANFWHVDVAGLEKAGVDIRVQSLLTDLKFIGIVCEDMVKGLSLLN